MKSNTNLGIPILSSAIIPRYSLRPRNVAQHNARTPFYRLASEVRMMIYEYLFGDSKMVVMSNGYDPHRHWPRGVTVDRGSILQVSKFVHSESKDLYHRRTVMWLYGNEDGIVVPPILRPRIEHIELAQGSNYDAYRRVLASLPSVKTVTIHLDDYRDSRSTPNNLLTDDHTSTVSSILARYDPQQEFVRAARSLENAFPRVQARIHLTVSYVAMRHGCKIEYLVLPATVTVKKCGFQKNLDKSKRLGGDRNCNICNMRNLIWLMCRLRTAVLVRRKRAARRVKTAGILRQIWGMFTIA